MSSSQTELSLFTYHLFDCPQAERAFTFKSKQKKTLLWILR